MGKPKNVRFWRWGLDVDLGLYLVLARYINKNKNTICQKNGESTETFKMKGVSRPTFT